MFSRYFERRQQIEQELRQRKAEVYEEFLDYWFWAMRDRSKAKPDVRKKRDSEYRRNVPQKIAVWGSESFIKEYATWFQADELDGSMLGFETLLRMVRADLGYKDSSIGEGDLLKVFLKGVDEHLDERDAASRWSN